MKTAALPSFFFFFFSLNVWKAVKWATASSDVAPPPSSSQPGLQREEAELRASDRPAGCRSCRCRWACAQLLHRTGGTLPISTAARGLGSLSALSTLRRYVCKSLCVDICLLLRSNAKFRSIKLAFSLKKMHLYEFQKEPPGACITFGNSNACPTKFMRINNWVIYSRDRLLPCTITSGKYRFNSGFRILPAKKAAGCGSRCVTQLRAPRLCVSPTLLRDSVLQTSRCTSCTSKARVLPWFVRDLTAKKQAYAVEKKRAL